MRDVVIARHLVRMSSQVGVELLYQAVMFHQVHVLLHEQTVMVHQVLLELLLFLFIVI